MKTWDDLKDETIGKRGIIPVFCADMNSPPRMDAFFNVHGSITFGGPRNTSTDWWIGFDCGHSGDGRDPSIMDPEYLRIHLKYGHDGEIRTNEYVEAECRSLAQQIAAAYPLATPRVEELTK